MLHYEGMERVLRSVFPPVQNAMSFKLGLSGCSLTADDARPNSDPGNPKPHNPALTLADCFVNEAGTPYGEIRSKMGYTRKTITFNAAVVAGAAIFETGYETFSNGINWSPVGDWDDPTTPTLIEEPPPDWDKNHWETLVNYPWMAPTVKADDSRNTDAFFSDPALWWLSDFHKLSGFPISLAFIYDNVSQKLVCSSVFRSPVLFRPGGYITLKYRGRIDAITKAFSSRIATAAFGGGGSNSIGNAKVFPVLETWSPTRDSIYANMLTHVAKISNNPVTPQVITGWTFQPYVSPPGEVLPYIYGNNYPLTWNNTGIDTWKIKYIAVTSQANELLWWSTLANSVTVTPSDVLRIVDPVQFSLRGV